MIKKTGRRAVTAVLAAAMMTFGLAPSLAQSPPVRGPLPTRLPPAPVVAPPTAPLPPQSQAFTPGPLQIVLRPDQAQLLMQALSQGEAHGFDPGEFAPAGNDQASLVNATLRYAKAVHSGRLQISGFREDWGLKPQPYDPTPGFVQAVAADRLQDWLNSLPPPYTGYQTLQRGLANYRGIEARGGWRSLPVVGDLKPGATGPQVEALRARLAVEDRLVPATVSTVPPQAPGAPPPAPGAARPGDPIYDAALTDAVKRAQKRFGLEPTGAIGDATRTALDIPVDQRIGQIIANMERWRWLPQQLPSDRIQVNIAAAVLSLFQGDEPILSMRAVTGRPGNETPMLVSQIQTIVLNPPWNVPASIASKELWPKERASPGYLRRNGYVLMPDGAGGSRIVQPAGPNAALGVVKFDFPNPYAVYLHDTPTKTTFGRYTRLASHGCVRLEKPRLLAETLLAGDPVWTPEQINATIATGKTVRVPVGRPISVFLLYWTAYMTQDGQMNFRGDPYGWDGLLIQRIAAQGGAV
ncbi:murein L,D-transpeptidase YcbB/YkuD [Caulobacter ginsengisoli]|uniref:Murein L,D-transpeptidase YcbB/YkuD n=1 Tax=Caulobacter ginsengisoli TaxID=400775 RepID=A0ABU0IN22_9CAUL|nr:L,D-transpeptidase family protein [Caulobacter ginsengisoli]MDQ0463402.1 murein L,D-transpeptidase YcbB/YkuD [Caulobacter ginsengisoli]